MTFWIPVVAILVLTIVIWGYFKYKMIKTVQNLEVYTMMLLINSEIYDDHRQKFDDFLKTDVAKIPHEGSKRSVVAANAMNRMALKGEGNWHVIVQKHMAEL
jgi:hypothetical protein